ncbi:hypothetical protein NONO_c23050 [Nocardia nova SH22a]|uniref:Uncharacterized protein n=1 Tax=Nocardia nova SH22a TaxID=1415166 RepID=W5TIN2_9NOCA|nr:hypothetical protein [Nocardia nova]AHH17101.1 hypothetical protein NONO_c23050 [Nocardia nova SH22a]
MKLRLLGSGSDHGTCPAVYASDVGPLVVQGDVTPREGVVLVPHALLDWLEPGMTLPVEATGTAGEILVPGEPLTDPSVLSQLRLADHETAVVVR